MREVGEASQPPQTFSSMGTALLDGGEGWRGTLIEGTTSLQSSTDDPMDIRILHMIG